MNTQTIAEHVCDYSPNCNNKSSKSQSYSLKNIQEMTKTELETEDPILATLDPYNLTDDLNDFSPNQ